MLRSHGGGAPPVSPVLDPERVAELQALTPRIHVEEDVLDYVVALTTFTRKHPRVVLGASPRASLSLLTAARALAILKGRTYVTPDDVRRLEKERIAWAAAQAALGRALIANARGQGAATAPMFAAAADMLDHVNLEHYAAAARLRAAAQQGGGANDGSAWLAREGVRRPDRMLAMLAPVRWT